MPSRRDFLLKCLKMWPCLYAICPVGIPGVAQPSKSHVRLHRADYWESLPGSGTRCLLCPNRCIVRPGGRGRCRSRGNRDGIYYSLVYGRPCVIALDDIGKSPLYHFVINGRAFSIATTGCNLSCLYCQNWRFSQVGPNEVERTFNLDPAEVIARARRHRVPAINFFYTEPTVYYEYMRDVARLARQEGIKTVCVTGGYINEEPLRALIPLIDAFVVGLKGFNDTFYRRYIGGRLEPVKRTLRILAENRRRTWYEIVNLIVPTLNDREATLRAMSRWIARRLSIDVPLHFTRFSPAYKLRNLPITPAATLNRARAIALEAGLQYVYIGNLPGSEAVNTRCPRCHRTVIERVNFTILENRLQNGRCTCGHPIPGRW